MACHEHAAPVSLSELQIGPGDLPEKYCKLYESQELSVIARKLREYQADEAVRSKRKQLKGPEKQRQQLQEQLQQQQWQQPQEQHHGGRAQTLEPDSGLVDSNPAQNVVRSGRRAAPDASNWLKAEPSDGSLQSAEGAAPSKQLPVSFHMLQLPASVAAADLSHAATMEAAMHAQLLTESSAAVALSSHMHAEAGPLQPGWQSVQPLSSSGHIHAGLQPLAAQQLLEKQVAAAFQQQFAALLAADESSQAVHPDTIRLFVAASAAAAAAASGQQGTDVVGW